MTSVLVVANRNNALCVLLVLLYVICVERFIIRNESGHDYDNVELTGDVDLTRQSETVGQDVLQSTVNQICDSSIFPNDNGMLRRIAHVESNDGNNADTYREGFHGGIWQVELDKFEVTQDVDVHPNLKEFHNKIDNHFGINWPVVEWRDLRKPLHSGLGARLYLETVEEPIPTISDIDGQAKYWRKYYNTNPDGSEETFKTQLTTFGKGEEVNLSKLDLIFVMDGSGSICSGNFEKAKEFVMNMVEKLDVGEERTHVGVIQYSSSPRIEISLNQHTSSDTLKSAISNIKYINEGTATGAAIEMMSGVMCEDGNGARPKDDLIPRVAVVMTDGQSDDAVQRPADEAREKGITIFSIGIGTGVNIDELNQIANQPSDSYRFEVIDFDKIDTIIHFVQSATLQASVHVEPDQPVKGMLEKKERRHFTFAIPKSNKATFTLYTPEGQAVIYLSTKGIASSSFHERKLESSVTSRVAQLYIDRTSADNGEIKIHATVENRSPENTATFFTLMEIGDHITSDYQIYLSKWH